jgi:hypothetical protein
VLVMMDTLMSPFLHCRIKAGGGGVRFQCRARCQHAWKDEGGSRPYKHRNGLIHEA